MSARPTGDDVRAGAGEGDPALADLRRRRFHRQKAHLVISALRHRAAELGDQAHFAQVETYAEALAACREPLSVCAPTTWSSRDYVLGRPDLRVLAARGFVT